MTRSALYRQIRILDAILNPEPYRYPCRVCGKPIMTGELCADCAVGPSKANTQPRGNHDSF